jgi:hypothetical protein
MHRPENGAGRSTGAPPPASEPAQSHQRRNQCHPRPTTLRGCVAMAWATAALLEELLDDRRARCLPTRDLAPLAAAARELQLAQGELEPRDGGAV